MNIKKLIRLWRNDLLNLIYPDLCQACDTYLLQGEVVICTKCLFHLPKTNFHQQENNPVSMLFWGRVRIEYAASFYTFEKGSKYQKLIHKLKYHNRPEIGIELGKHLGYILGKSEMYKSIDIIVPVPLHPKKRKLRGYNQSEMIVKGISESMQKPADMDSLIRQVHTESQTKKGRLERWENVDNVFQVKETEPLANKHILLVDDVVTTGSTLEACAQVLLNIEGTRVSIATLAYA